MKWIRELINVWRFAALLAMSLKAVCVFGELVASYKKIMSVNQYAGNRLVGSSYVEAPAAHRNPCLK